MSLFPDVAAFEAALIDLPRMDEATLFDARARQAQLTKPAGSLGRLEEIALFMAGWQGTERPRAERVKAALFAGNHGVAARGVSAFPIEVTAQMVANFQAGGAAINALAGGCGAELSVIPLDLDRPTGDIAIEPAMSEADCLAALNAGAAQVPPDADLMFVGEMGIGNTTPAAALCAQPMAAARFRGAGAEPGWTMPGLLARSRRSAPLWLCTGHIAPRPSKRSGGSVAAKSRLWPAPFLPRGCPACRSCSTGSSAVPPLPPWWR